MAGQPRYDNHGKIVRKRELGWTARTRQPRVPGHASMAWAAQKGQARKDNPERTAQKGQPRKDKPCSRSKGKTKQPEEDESENRAATAG
jgi:hypothetical protein